MCGRAAEATEDFGPPASVGDCCLRDRRHSSDIPQLLLLLLMGAGKTYMYVDNNNVNTSFVYDDVHVTIVDKSADTPNSGSNSGNNENGIWGDLSLNKWRGE